MTQTHRSSGPFEAPAPYKDSPRLPDHLQDWQLPPGWSWGTEGLYGQHRHYQEIIDALGRSLSLVSAPNAEHSEWLEAESVKDDLEHIRKWPPEHWKLAFQGQVRRVSDGDADLLLERMRSRAGSPLAR